MTDANAGEPGGQKSPAGEPQNKKPSLVINVYSWWTLVVGLLMLAVGLVGGYYLHPLVGEGATEAGLAPSSINSGTPTIPTPTVDPTVVAASRQEMMTFMVENTRHFIGEPDAEITIIEFSDFQ
jgi:hypothetical protein